MNTEEKIKPSNQADPVLNRTDKYRVITIVIGIILIALISFACGLAVGFKKARFSYGWGEQYERNFAGPPPPHFGPPGEFIREFEGPDFRNAHGLSGSIISISDKKLIVKDRDEKENTIAVTDKTLIKKRNDSIKFEDLKTEDRIVVLGQPGDDGVINADLIRIFENNP